MKKYRMSAILAAGAAALVMTAGCNCKKAAGCDLSNLPEYNEAGRRSAYAAYTATPAGADGKLDEAAWKNAPAYHLTRPINWKSYYKDLTPEQLAKYGDSINVMEDCTMQMLYDNENLYLGFQLTDTEIKAKGTKDQEAHFVLGDLVEIFIKPENQDYYWEMYSTPKEHKTCYEFVGCRKGAEGNENLQLDFSVASNVNGTIEEPSDTDKGWSTVVTIPLKSLAKYGEEFKGDGSWTLLIGRYNYLNDSFPKEELSAFPQITAVDFHALPEYAAIKFLPSKSCNK